MKIDFFTWAIWSIGFIIWVLWAYYGWKEFYFILKSRNLEFKNKNNINNNKE